MRAEPVVAPVVAEPVAQPQPVFEQPAAALNEPEPDPSEFFDLAHELELSMRSETAAAPAAFEEPVFNAPTFDMSVFDEIDLGEAPPVADVAPVEARREVAAAPQPVNRVEPSFEQPLSFTAARPEVVTPPSPAVSAAEPEMSEVDKLLADVARFPVPPVAARAVEVAPLPSSRPVEVPVEAAVPSAEPAVPGKKQNYPFTPVFSRATPVAGAGGPRSYTAPPTVEPVVEIPRAPVAVAAAAPVVAAAAVAAVTMPEPVAARPAAPAAEPEPDFDLANFEQELSAIQFDFDSFEEPARAEPAPTFEAVAPQPHYEPEPVQEETYVEAEEPLEELLPFDPSMISETEEHPSAIAEMDVPALPVHEEPQPAVAHHADFDLDLDAEMAQLFAEHQSAPATRPVVAAAAVAEQPAAAADMTDAFNIFSRDGQAATISDFQVDEDVRRAFEAQRAEFGNAPDRIDAFNYEAYDNVAAPAGEGRSRLPIYAAAAAIVLMLGGVGVYAWMGGSEAALTAEGPKVILADKEPVKIVPEEKGGKTVPNQDKAVYDRVAGTQGEAPRQDALVSTKEEPLDVVQRTLTPETLPLQGEDEVAANDVDPAGADNRLLPEGQEAAAAAKDEQNPAVAPRKVRTMIVKPDGTLVAREETVSEPATTTTASTPVTTPDAASQTNVALAAPSANVQTVTTTPVAGTAAEQPQTIDAAAAAATPAAETPAIDTPANTPVPQMRRPNSRSTSSAPSPKTAICARPQRPRSRLQPQRRPSRQRRPLPPLRLLPAATSFRSLRFRAKPMRRRPTTTCRPSSAA